MRSRRKMIGGLLAVLWIFSATGAAERPQPHASNPAVALGVQPYRGETWGIVSVSLLNPTDRDARILVSSSVRSAPSKQYGRLFWVPAGSRRVSWHPIFLPKPMPPDAKSVTVDSVVLDRTESVEALRKDRLGTMTHDGVLRFTSDKGTTGVIADLPEPGRNGRDAEIRTAMDCIASCRFRALGKRSTLAIVDKFLPPISAAWDGLDNLVLIGDRIASDAAAVRAVRRWLQRGGRLWIMLEHVRPETVERLLGDACPYEEVDRVGLTRLRLETPDISRWAADAQPRDHEQPVTLVRTLVSDVQVTHTVNGWPAAYWQQFGRGKILYTALGTRGWIRPTGPRDKYFSNAGLRYVPRPPLEDLVVAFYAPAQPSPLKSEIFEPYLSQQIGYEVVEFHTVLSILGVFCASLILVGVWLIRRRRLDLLRWIGPGAAVVAAGALVFAGRQTRHSVPETVAVIQLVEVEPDSEDVSVSGLVAVYRHDASEKPVAVARGGLLAPDFTEQTGTTRRMIWTDLDSWHWENLTVPSGVHLSTIRYSTAIKRPIRATGRFGPAGLAGTLEAGPFRHPADAVFATPARFNLAVRLDKDGNFTAGPDEMLAAGEYILGTLLSDEQRRRQSVYRQLLPNRARSTFVDRPTLLVWAEPIDIGLQISADATKRGAALLSIPLRLERSPPDTTVTIPAAFLPYQRVEGPPDLTSSNHYNNRDGTWLERTLPARTWLRVQVPPQVAPLRIDQLTVTVLISGKLQKLDIIGLVDGKPVTLATRPRPVGVQRISIDASEALRLDATGGVTIGVVIGDMTTQPVPKLGQSGEKWNIDYLQLEIAGTTLKHDASKRPPSAK